MLTLIKQFQEEFKNKYGFTPDIEVHGHRVNPSLAENIVSSFGESEYGTYDSSEWNLTKLDNVKITMFHGVDVDDEF